MPPARRRSRHERQAGCGAVTARASARPDLHRRSRQEVCASPLPRRATVAVGAALALTAGGITQAVPAATPASTVGRAVDDRGSVTLAGNGTYTYEGTTPGRLTRPRGALNYTARGFSSQETVRQPNASRVAWASRGGPDPPRRRCADRWPARPVRRPQLRGTPPGGPAGSAGPHAAAAGPFGLSTCRFPAPEAGCRSSRCRARHPASSAIQTTHKIRKLTAADPKYSGGVFGDLGTPTSTTLTPPGCRPAAGRTGCWDRCSPTGRHPSAHHRHHGPFSGGHPGASCAAPDLATLAQGTWTFPAASARTTTSLAAGIVAPHGGSEVLIGPPSPV